MTKTTKSEVAANVARLNAAHLEGVDAELSVLGELLQKRTANGQANKTRQLAYSDHELMMLGRSAVAPKPEAPIKPTPILAIPNVPRTRVVHMSRVLKPESKHEDPDYLQAALVLRSRGETLVILREDLEGNEP